MRNTAAKTVFAEGNPQSGLMIVGDAPDADEDLSGRPFVGPAGQLLDKMLAAIGITRENCLLTNLIPWRPPGGRVASDMEIAQCLPFLLRHIELVRPRTLVLMGAIAAQAVLHKKDSIRRLRGHWRHPMLGAAGEVATLTTYHPSFLQNHPSAKREAWADLIALKIALLNRDLQEGE